jgi:hypothetical protein
MDARDQVGATTTTTTDSTTESGGSRNSCRNSIRDGSRSISEFPPELLRKIAEKEAALRQDLKPGSELESSAVTEMARATVQHEFCDDQVYINAERARLSVDVTWDDDQRTHVNTVAARLRKAPERVAHELECSLQGAQYCLERWIGLGETVAAKGELTEDQRQLCFDLQGVPEVLRNSTWRVPAAKDTEGLKTLIASQVERLQTRINMVLKDRDLRAQDSARRGNPRVLDPETRRVRSNAARAYKRFVTATERLCELLAARASANVVKPAARPAQAPPPPPPPPPRPSPAASTASSAYRADFTGPVNSSEADRARAERRAERIRRNSPGTAADAQRAAAEAAAAGGANPRPSQS